MARRGAKSTRLWQRRLMYSGDHPNPPPPSRWCRFRDPDCTFQLFPPPRSALLSEALMTPALSLEKFTIGVGDRFAHQAKAQLRACQMLAHDGIDVSPVWNKSNREHSFIGSEPASVLNAAREAVIGLGWTKGWHVDADHIRLETVDRFIPHSDFFTIDVADSIGQPAAPEAVQAFVERHPELIGAISIPK